MARSEKELIEAFNAKMFLRLYNETFGAKFEVAKHRDSPDFECADKSSGETFGLEMTMTMDRELDIAARLGRSRSRLGEVLSEHLDAVRAGKASALERADTPEMWNGQLVRCLEAKAAKDYGKNVALAIRDASPMGWDIDQRRIADSCRKAASTFDRGVWLFDESERLTRLDV